MKAAIVGVGRMGRRHIRVVKQAGLDLVGVVDPDAEALKAAQDEYALPPETLFRDVDALFDGSGPECLIIATTADSHCELTTVAVARGVKYVLVEKPLAVSLDECDRMIETCSRAGVRLAVNHQMRFMEQYTVPKKLVSTEAYGGLSSMTVVGGNFGFAMVGTHYFEAFRFLTGERVSEVTAWFSPEVLPNPRGPRFQDRSGSIRAVTASGKRLYMEIGADQGHGIRVVYGCRNGMLTVNALTGELLSTARAEEHRDLPTTRYGMPGVDLCRSLAPAEVIDSSVAVLTALLHDSNNVTGEDGRAAIEVLVAAHESAERGSVPVMIGLDLDRQRTYSWA